MYIEQLTEKDFKQFANIFDCGVDNVKKSNNEIYIRLFTGAMGPQPELWISDFDLRTSIYYRHAQKRLKKVYIQFMYDKFGEQYKQDYANNYNKQVEENRII